MFINQAYNHTSHAHSHTSQNRIHTQYHTCMSRQAKIQCFIKTELDFLKEMELFSYTKKKWTILILRHDLAMIVISLIMNHFQ